MPWDIYFDCQRRGRLDLFTLRQNLLLLALDLLDALPWRWEVFGHSAAEVFDGIADFLADGVMRQVGIFFSLHVVAAQFGFGLGGAEEIGRQIFDAHVIQDVLAFRPFFLWMSLAFMPP